jgi:hypothetical protein
MVARTTSGGWIISHTLIEKMLSLAHQKGLSPAHFGAPMTLMPVVILIAGALCYSPAVWSYTAGE